MGSNEHQPASGQLNEADMSRKRTYKDALLDPDSDTTVDQMQQMNVRRSRRLQCLPPEETASSTCPATSSDDDYIVEAGSPRSSHNILDLSTSESDDEDLLEIPLETADTSYNIFDQPPAAGQNQDHVESISSEIEAMINSTMMETYSRAGSNSIDQDEELPDVDLLDELVPFPAPSIPSAAGPLYRRPTMPLHHSLMWFRQQAALENRRRAFLRADSNHALFVPLPTETEHWPNTAMDTAQNTVMAGGRVSPYDLQALFYYHRNSSLRDIVTTLDALLWPLARQSLDEAERQTIQQVLLERIRQERIRATPEMIANNTVTYQYTSTSNPTQAHCVICLAEFELGEPMRRLPCVHVFHLGCVDKWLLDNRLCPICRTSIIAEEASSNSNNAGTFEGDSSADANVSDDNFSSEDQTDEII